MFRTLALAGLLALSATAARADLKPGAPAPDFAISAALAGKSFTFALAEALKKGPVVLYFYPKSFTRVCTEEAHAFAEAADDFSKLDATIIGVSSDTLATQRQFSALECRNRFAVGADPDMTVIRAYDAGAGNAAYARRISYVIAPDGRIVSAVADTGAASRHITRALAVVKALHAIRGGK